MVHQGGVFKVNQVVGFRGPSQNQCKHTLNIPKIIKFNVHLDIIIGLL
jgi:hypothetical protein